MKVFVFAVTALLVINYVSGIGYGNCPPKNKVLNNQPTCHSDADCQKFGKLCCPNQFNTKSCVDRAPYVTKYDDRSSNKDKYNKYNRGVGGRAY